jgi:hypothetical protein
MWYSTCGTEVNYMAIVTTRHLIVTDQSVRVLRWTYRRDHDAVVCELGLNADNSAYELRVNLPWNPVDLSTELFHDATSAFDRHAALERMLVDAGWMLEAFESDRIFRSA